MNKMVSIRLPVSSWMEIVDAAERIYTNRGGNPSVMRFTAAVTRGCRGYNSTDVVAAQLHSEAFTILAEYAAKDVAGNRLGAVLAYLTAKGVGPVPDRETSPRVISADARRLRAEVAAGLHEYRPKYIPAGETETVETEKQGRLF